MLQSGPMAVLPAVARVVAEAPTLGDAVSNLARTLQGAIPFERLHLLRLDRAESVVLYIVRASGELEVTGHRISDQADAPQTDPDTRSRMICPIRHGARVHGALWFTSSQPDAFCDEHQELMDAVANLVALAVHSEGLRVTEALRRERIESLDRLLHTMA